MIESYYWRQELKADLRWLREHSSFRRWSEKQMVLYERRLILVACQIRILIEQHRVRNVVAQKKLECTWHKKVGGSIVTRRNAHRFDEHFAMDKPQPVDLNARELANQLIHHYEMYALAEGRRFVAVAVFSDYMRNQGLYIIDVSALLDYLAVFAKDDSAVTRMSSIWNEKRQDYEVSVD